MADTLRLRAPCLPERLTHWQQSGWLSATDSAFAALLAEAGDETDPTVLTFAALASHVVANGYTRLPLDRLHDDPAMLWDDPPPAPESDATPIEWLGQLNLDDLRDRLTAAVSVERIETGVTASAQTTPLVLQDNTLYLRRYWANERLIEATLTERLHHEPLAIPDLRARLDALFPPGADQTIDWQRVACALATRSRFTLITGGPGTGKTRTVLRLLGLLQAQRMDTDPDRPLRIRLAAPTGKAAARLGESINAEIDALPLPAAVRDAIPRTVSTLHRLLGPRPGSRLFRHDRHNPLHADLVVVDEASMIDQELTARLLDALRPATRLVVLGDKDQLASVEAGAVLGEFCAGTDHPHYHAATFDWLRDAAGVDISTRQGPGRALQQHIVKLRESRRFSADSGIGAFAEAVRTGHLSRAAAHLDGPDTDIERLLLNHADDPAIEQAAVEGYRSYLSVLQQSRPEDDERSSTDEWARGVLRAFTGFQVLTSVRQGPLGVVRLNERIAGRLQQAGWIDRASGWFEGRAVMITRNDYELGLMNGDVGICLATRLPGETEPRLRVAFELADQRIRLLLPSRLDAVESVFAMTIHKAQGSEFDQVLVVLPGAGLEPGRPELLYTAVTRARAGAWIAHPRA